MAAKRFLGLGFTFTATDKGLEKKLKSLSGLVKDINSGLKALSANADDAGKSVGKMPMPKGSQKSQNVSNAIKEKEKESLIPRASQSVTKIIDDKVSENMMPKSAMENIAAMAVEGANKSVTSDEKLNVSVEPPKSDKSEGKIGNEFKKTFDEQKKSIKSLLTKDLIEDFQEGVIDSFDKAINKSQRLGKSFEDSLRAGVFAASETLEEFSKVKLESLQVRKYFDAIGNYLGRVKDSFENFLDSIGINLRQLIPKEVVAAFGVLKTLVEPLATFIKSSLKKGAEFVLTKIGTNQTRIAKQNLAIAKQQLSAIEKSLVAAYDPSSGAIKVQSDDGQSKEKKKGLFSRILDALKGALFGGLTAVGAGLLWLGSKLMKFKLIAKIVSYLAVPFDKLKDIVSKMPKVFSRLKASVVSYLGMFKNVIKEVVLGFLRLGAIKFTGIALGILALGASIFSIGKVLWDGRDKIFGFFSELGTTISLVGSLLFDSLSVAFAPVTKFLSPVFDSLVSGLKSLGDSIGLTSITFTSISDAIIGAVKAVVEFFTKTIGSVVGGKIVSLFESMSRGLSSVNSDLRKIRDSNRNKLFVDQMRVSSQSNLGNKITPINVQTDFDPANEQVADNTKVIIEQNQRLIQLQEQALAANARNVMNTSKRSASASPIKDFIKATNVATAAVGGSL